MNTISSEVAKQFCELCNWTYECWLTHKRLFDKNEKTEETIGKAKYFTARLSIITQEYSLLQICKLHDPTKNPEKPDNITINYIVESDDWGTDTPRINEYGVRLGALYKKLKPARNKLLAHNDFKVIMGGKVLGEFPEGLDEEYFSVLQELVNAVHEKWHDGPYLFNDLVGADVEEFLQVLEKPEQSA